MIGSSGWEREQRGIVDHDVYVGRHDHDVEHEQGGDPRVEAEQQGAAAADLDERYDPAIQVLETGCSPPRVVPRRRLPRRGQRASSLRSSRIGPPRRFVCPRRRGRPQYSEWTGVSWSCSCSVLIGADPGLQARRVGPPSGIVLSYRRLVPMVHAAFIADSGWRERYRERHRRAHRRPLQGGQGARISGLHLAALPNVRSNQPFHGHLLSISLPPAPASRMVTP